MPLRNIARIAQLVEHLICNQDVVGSTPTAGSIFFNQEQSDGKISS